MQLEDLNLCKHKHDNLFPPQYNLLSRYPVLMAYFDLWQYLMPNVLDKICDKTNVAIMNINYLNLFFKKLSYRPAFRLR